jgi:CheY-like chemotaxis protein
MTQPVILLAEDRADDVVLVRKAFHDAYIDYPIKTVSDGEELMAYLQGEGKFADRKEFPIPSVLLLDLKMPRKDGFEVLRWLRAQPKFRDLPVIVLTASENIRDANAAYQLGANSFLVKPMDFINFVQMARVINSYWLRFNISTEQPQPRPTETTQPLGKPQPDPSFPPPGPPG